MSVRRRRPPTREDYARIRAGFERAGLDRDFYSGDDIALLWGRGWSIDAIVSAAMDDARRRGTTKGVELA